MAQGFVEVLKRKTEQARVARAEEGRVDEQDEKSRTEQDVAEQSAITAFVECEIDGTVANITERATESAEGGLTHSATVWEFRYDDTCLPLDEMAKYRALRDRAAEHFIDMGVAVHIIDGDLREEAPNADWRAERGISPYPVVGKEVGVELSWA